MISEWFYPGTSRKVIVSELKEMKSKFVIVELNETLTKIISETTDYNVVLGDARKEDILKKAGIEKTNYSCLKIFTSNYFG